MSELEKLEKIVDELDYQNILLKNEIQFAEDLCVTISQDLEECVETLKEVARFLQGLKRGPRQRVRDCIMRAENKENIKKAEYWITAKKARIDSESEVKSNGK